MVQKLEERPPFVRFETRSFEDREATIKQGHYVGIDVDFALITPSGSKDIIERNVSEWFQQLREQVMQERMNADWANAFYKMYDAFKEGKEAPLVGTPVINWPGLSPSQVKQLVSLNLRAVEDVAIMNEESIARLGMGGRALKDRAVAWLAAARDVGMVAEASAALKLENEELKRSNENLNQQVQALAAQVAAIAQAQQHVAAVTATAPQTSISAADLLDDNDLGAKL
jgi:FtsZ-binding cell division protein ZapB